MLLAKVYIRLKTGVNDPQGLTVRGGLHQLGFDSVVDVRVGKYMEIQLSSVDVGEARERVTAMCEQLLANPIIEDYSFEIVEA